MPLRAGLAAARHRRLPAQPRLSPLGAAAAPTAAAGAPTALAATRRGAADARRQGRTAPAKDAPTTPTAKADARRRRRRRAPGTQSIVALVNDEPITGYEIEQRVTLSLLGAPEVQQQAAGEAQIAEHQRPVQGLRHEAAARPIRPRREAEQQARVKQLQAQFVESIKRQVEARVRADSRARGARRADRGAPEAAGGQAPQRRRRRRGGRPHHQRHGRAQQDDAAAVRRAHGEDGRQHRRHARSASGLAVLERRHPPHASATRSPSPSRDVDRFVATAEGQDDVELRVQRILLADAGQARPEAGSPSA